jgi:uncharacterized protein (DUF2267 family)
MQYKTFIGQVQHRAQMPSQQDAVRATRVVLETLSRRMVPGEAKDLASQLPPEIGRFLVPSDTVEKFSLDEFFKKVSKEENVDLPVAVYHARVVVEVLQEAVSGAEIKDIRQQLPDDWQNLFEAGSKGKMQMT